MTSSSQPPANIPIASVRALRVLDILMRETDAAHHLTTIDIKHKLAHPDNPSVAAITTTRETIRTTIMALRYAGHDVSSSTQDGYWIERHPFSDTEMALALDVVRTSPALEVVERRALEQCLRSLATPTQRTFWSAGTHAGPSQTGDHGTRREGHVVKTLIPFSVVDIPTLVRRALDARRAIAYQVMPDEGADGGAEPESAWRSMVPQSIRAVEDGVFVGGTDGGAPGGRRSMVRLERMVYAVAPDIDGVTLLATRESQPPRTPPAIEQAPESA